jgi:hypothetical protein
MGASVAPTRSRCTVIGATVDLDILIESAIENAKRVWRALATFGAPLDDLDVTENDLTRPISPGPHARAIASRTRSDTVRSCCSASARRRS